MPVPHSPLTGGYQRPPLGWCVSLHVSTITILSSFSLHLLCQQAFLETSMPVQGVHNPFFSFISPWRSSYLSAAQSLPVMLNSTDGKGELAQVKSKYSKLWFCEVDKLKLGACRNSLSFPCGEKNKSPTPVMHLIWKISLTRSWFCLWQM